MTTKKLRRAMITFLALILAAALLLPAGSTAAMPQAQEASGGIPTDRIIIKYKDGTSAQADPSASALMNALSVAAGVPLEYARAMSGDAHVLQLGGRLPESQVEAISASLMTLPGVEYAEPDRIKRPALTLNDPRFSDQWNLMLDTNPDENGVAYGINAKPAWNWDITTGSESVVVAVVDTGITSHEDLSRIVPGYDFISDDIVGSVPKHFTANDGNGRDTDPTDSGDWITAAEDAGTDPTTGAFFQGCGVSDSSWHGTHVAGIIGASSNNGTGIAGVDWNAKILPVRVLGKCGGYTSDIVDGIRWAAGLSVSGAPPNLYPAKVINLSLGGPGACTVTEQNAINDAVNVKGAVVVAAAGNENANAGSFSPGNCSNVITVAATDKNGSRASFSNYGAAVEISAPGGGNGQGDILSTVNGSTTTPNSVSAYAEMPGTSMAAPHVSGVVSLMFAVNPWMTPAHVLEILQKAVTPFPEGSACDTSNCGAGIVNAHKAVRLAQMPDVLITDVTLSKVDPGLGEQFAVNVTVKNRGGSITDSIINLQIYVDRNPMDPSNPLFIDEADGGALLKREGGPEDLGEFVLDRGSSKLTANGTTTYSVIINNTGEPYNTWTENLPVPWGSGTHDLYVYADANGINEESFEKNNHYPANPVTINPFIEGALLYPKNGQNIGADYNPTFRWNKTLKVNGKTEAEQYRIYVSGPSGLVTDQWLRASSVCSSESNVCSVELGPNATLRNGTYSWYIQPYSAAGGYGPWSNNAQPTVFTTAGLGAAVLTSPAPNENIGTNYTPTLIWNKVNIAAWYRLYLAGPSGVVLDQWYQAGTICDLVTEGECCVQSPALGAGEHSWYVQTYAPNIGLGPWSNNTQPTKFRTAALTVGAAALLYPMEPNSSIKDIGTNYTPTYKWQRVDGATWYRIYVSGPAGVALDRWYQASAICGNKDPEYSDMDVCAVASPELRGGLHGWYVQTYGPNGYGPWSNEVKPMQFRTTATPPAAAFLAYPVKYEQNPSENPIKDIGTNYTPTFKWYGVDGATWYRIYVYGPSGGVVLDKWYQASAICRNNDPEYSGYNICAVTSPILGGGLHGWYVQTYGPGGFGAWSNSVKPAQFKTTLAVPGAASLTDPVHMANIGTNYNPIYKWNKAPEATYYRLYVSGPAGLVLDRWYPAGTICDKNVDNVCEVLSPTLMHGGAYSWYVQTYGTGGFGPWSNGAQPTRFSADVPTLPKAAANLQPAGITSNKTPIFRWQRVSMAIWYRLYVKSPAGVVRDQWYRAMDICVGDVCSVSGVTLANGDHEWWVQTYSAAGYGPWKRALLQVRP